MPNEPELDVLVLSAAVPQTWYAGSLLLYRLFQHYPPHRLKAVGPKPQPRSDVLPCEYAELQPAASSRLDLTRFAALKRSLEAIGLLGRIPRRRVEASVGHFRPQVVLTVMERLDYVSAAHRYCRRHNVPLALVVHDQLEAFDRVYAPLKSAQRRRIAAIYRDAAARFCVSPEMERRLAQQYGAPGTVLYPNRAEALSPRPSADSLTLKVAGRLTIAYAGALSYGYGDRIRELMPALSRAGVRLRLYSRDGLSEAIPGVDFGGSFTDPMDVWKAVAADCDAVWLPYSHDPQMRSLYETHFPSKLTEYLALGMPVVITGPDYATGVRWGLQNPDGTMTLTDPAPEPTVAALARLRDDGPLRQRLALAGTLAGNADFDPAAIRRRFFDTLRAIARAPEPQG